MKKDEWKFERPQDKMQRFEIPPVVLATQEFVQESERMKEAAAGVKDAAEKVRLGDYDAAISKLKAILDKNPKDSNALYIIGMAYLKKKMWPEADSVLPPGRRSEPEIRRGLLSAGDLLPAAEGAARKRLITTRKPWIWIPPTRTHPIIPGWSSSN